MTAHAESVDLPWLSKLSQRRGDAVQSSVALTMGTHDNSRNTLSFFIPLAKNKTGCLWWDIGLWPGGTRLGYRKVLEHPIANQRMFWGVYAGIEQYGQTIDLQKDISKNSLSPGDIKAMYYLWHGGVELVGSLWGKLTLTYYHVPVSSNTLAKKLFHNDFHQVPGLVELAPLGGSIGCFDGDGISIQLTHAFLSRLTGSIIYSSALIYKNIMGLAGPVMVTRVGIGAQCALSAGFSFQAQCVVFDDYPKNTHPLSLGIRYSSDQSNLSRDPFQGQLQRPPEINIPQYFNYAHISKSRNFNDHHFDRPSDNESGRSSKGSATSNRGRAASPKPKPKPKSEYTTGNFGTGFPSSWGSSSRPSYSNQNGAGYDYYETTEWYWDYDGTYKCRKVRHPINRQSSFSNAGYNPSGYYPRGGSSYNDTETAWEKLREQRAREAQEERERLRKAQERERQRKEQEAQEERERLRKAQEEEKLRTQEEQAEVRQGILPAKLFVGEYKNKVLPRRDYVIFLEVFAKVAGISSKEIESAKSEALASKYRTASLKCHPNRTLPKETGEAEDAYQKRRGAIAKQYQDLQRCYEILLKEKEGDLQVVPKRCKS